MKKFPIKANNEEYLNQTHMNPGTSPAPVHGVNVVLGGAMLSSIILAIFVLCYCCHKTNRKSTPASLTSMIWRDTPGTALQIYTVEAAQSRNLMEMEDCDTSANMTSNSRNSSRCHTPDPPPYDSLITDKKENSQNGDLPTYEAALRSLDHHTNLSPWTVYT